MTQADREAHISALRLLLSDKMESDIIYVISAAFPQFAMLYQHQLNSLRQGIDEVSGKAQMLRAQI
jgi:hypothetical protein